MQWMLAMAHAHTWFPFAAGAVIGVVLGAIIVLIDTYMVDFL